MAKEKIKEKPTIMLVEDHWLIGIYAQMTLEDLGCRVIGPVSDVREACLLVGRELISGALLDVFLGDDTCYAVADLLQAREIPFAFATGCTSEMLPEKFRNRPHIDKPYSYETLKLFIASLTTEAADGVETASVSRGIRACGGFC